MTRDQLVAEYVLSRDLSDRVNTQTGNGIPVVFTISSLGVPVLSRALEAYTIALADILADVLEPIRPAQCPTLEVAGDELTGGRCCLLIGHEGKHSFDHSAAFAQADGQAAA